MGITLRGEQSAARKLRDREARRAKIVSAARRIAKLEGWPSVTVRRLAEEISYSQPVLYGHFASREAIVTAVALEGFAELGRMLEEARKKAGRGSGLESVARAYLRFASSSPALYEAMFSMRLEVTFGAAATPPELRFAFAQLVALFADRSGGADVLPELFWAALHGTAELMRTGRFPKGRQNRRVSALVDLFRPRSGAG